MAADMFGGAVVAEGLKVLIAEAKKFKNFKPLSKDLASTMERLIPLAEKIDSLQNKLDLGVGELKGLEETLQRAQVVVHKCSRVKWYSLNRTMLTREIQQVNKEMLNFCQIDLQLLQQRNQLLSMDANNKNFQLVNEKLDRLAVSPPVYKYPCSVPKLDFAPVGLDWPLKELKKRLLDPTVISLGVSAPPGCGKTTLVTHLCNDKNIKGEFNIFFNVVSSSPNFRGIVQNLLQHNGEAAHTFENDTQAKDALRKLLKKLTQSRHVLLVFDDVWPGAEIPFLRNFQFELPNYKILVTSRSDISTLFSTYHLKPLKDEDARSLLIKWAALEPDHAFQTEYENVLQKILKRCNGFPIVIEVVGVSLRGQPLSSWEGQVESWSAGQTLLDDSTVLDCLQPSFNALKPHLKECFMDMGSFLEDQKIRASVIIDIWVGLYGEGNSMYMKYLNELASQNLLKLISLGGNGHEDGFYNDRLVTQHDILRELAICQSKSEENMERKRLSLEIKEDKFPDWCSDLMQPINARLLSISTDNGFSSKWVDLDCPNVEALVLNLFSLDYALPGFIARMKKLKVLTITNHGFSPARLSNFSCLRSLPNLKRIRLEKVSITLLDLLQLQLGSLEKLSLVMCGFGEVFYDAIEEMDVAKALPRLQEIDIDYCYDLFELPFWVCEVVSLKTLSITNCNKLTKLPEAIGKLSNLEVLRLSSSINLCELPQTTSRLSNLRFLDISDCLGLRKLPLEIGKLHKLKKISMRKCGRCELPDSVTKLENLVVKCDEETRMVLWERLKPKMRDLEVHQVETEHNLNMFNMF